MNRTCFAAPLVLQSYHLVSNQFKANIICTVPKRARTKAVLKTPNVPRVAVKSKGAVAPRKAAEVHVAEDRIVATPSQIGFVAAFGALSALVGVQIALDVCADVTLLPGVLTAAIVGWLFADFGSAVYHWSVDNYGNENTPIVGFQIAAFQGHHKSPWTITKREFANNLYRLTFPTSPQMAALLILPLPTVVTCALWSALFWIVASQELHKQAHMTRPAPYAKFLQDWGIAISSKEHGLHHSSPFEGHYGIVSGVWNRSLDSTNFFRKLESIVYNRTGVSPISWGLDPSIRPKGLVGPKREV